MRRARSRFAPIVVMLALMAAPATRSLGAQGRDATIIGPDTVSFRSGALTLRGIVYRPVSPGRHLTILFNHGSGTDYTREIAAVGPTYARLGFVFFAPARRGQWLSEATGQYIIDSLDAIEKLKGEAARDPLLVSLMKGPQLDDVRAARDFIVTQPFVDPRRVVAAGNSFGGIVTIFASANLDGLYAAVDFAGAAQTWGGAPTLQAAMTDAVKHARVPVFFGQAENDYDLTPSRMMSAAMNAAGRPNEMRIFPPFGASTPEGHSFGYFGGVTWGPVVADFLAHLPEAR